MKLKDRFERLKTNLTLKRNQSNCERGKHRWAKALEKHEDGTASEWYFCQTCGEREDDNTRAL